MGWAAFGALAAMGVLDVHTEIRDQMARATDRHEKLSVVDDVRANQIRDAADLLVEYAADAGWVAGDDELRTQALITAATLGSEIAVVRLREVALDSTASPCTRACAAIALIDLGQGEFLESCLEFLRLHGQLEQELDPRDSWHRRNEILEATVDAVVRFASQHREAFLSVVDVLDAMRRPRQQGPAGMRAWKAIPAMTGIESYSEFDAWRARQPDRRG
jgi:hypothetical protein